LTNLINYIIIGLRVKSQKLENLNKLNKRRFMKKPKSWAQLLEHPEIHSIDDGRKEFPDSGEMEIYISIHDGVENPVTGEKGGGFFVGSFKDALDHFRCDWD
jgi:secreted Zn-dependent insulinase-like peptidase